MDMLSLLLLSVLPALTIVGGLHDLTTMKIPNWISIALVAAFWPIALFAGLSPTDLALHLGVGVAALAVGMALFALNWIGGGDAKLMAATCLWMGPGATLSFVIYTAMVGGLFSLLLMAARNYAPGYAGPGAPAWLSTLMQPKAAIPYGVAIAIGALLAYPSSQAARLLLGA